MPLATSMPTLPAPGDVPSITVPGGVDGPVEDISICDAPVSVTERVSLMLPGYTPGASSTVMPSSVSASASASATVAKLLPVSTTLAAVAPPTVAVAVSLRPVTSNRSELQLEAVTVQLPACGPTLSGLTAQLLFGSPSTVALSAWLAPAV